ncbi:MAG: NUDIX hydrolase [Gammaproteobacteria bacterium]|nr:NUDIX hydrolase [Gammaproteobacteria bacterium]
MKYCTQCGSKTAQLIPEGDQKLRHVCTQCETVHYLNPKIITGCLVEHEDKILLCRRAIEPQSGKWTLPAGFMENNETCIQGAIRETREEANAEVRELQLYSVYDIPHISQVYMIYRARLNSLNFSPGIESTDVQLFEKADIPWQQLAFSVIRETLISYYKDRQSEQYRLHTGVITPEMKSLLKVRPEGI